MKEISIRNSIILGAAGVILIPFFIAGIITYAKLSTSLESLSREKGTQIAKDVASIVEMTMSLEIKFIRSVSANPYIVQAASTGNYALSDAILSEIYRTIGRNYEGLFITDRQGIIRSDAVDRKRRGIDVSSREYFTQARKGVPNFSKPVVSKATGRLIMVVAAPIVTKRGDFLGIAAGTLNIDYMIANITSIKLGNTGYPFVVDTDGSIIIHIDKGHILKTNLHDLPGMKRITQKMLNHETGSEEYVYNGIEKIAGFAPIPTTGWSVAFTQNRDEIMDPAKSMLVFIAFCGLLFLLTAAAGILFLSKRIGEPLEKTIQTFNEIASHTMETVVTIGPDRKIRWANQVMESQTGRTLKELIGTEPELTNLGNIPPHEIWARLESGSAWSGRLMMKGAGNEGIIVDTLIIPIKDEKGTIHSYMEIGHDITQELQIEKRLGQAQKIEAVGTLAGGIAHDFNNILASIFGFVQISLMTLDDKEMTKRNLEDILKAAERARDLVRQILAFSRPSETNLKPIAPSAVVADTLNLVRASTPTSIDIYHSIKSGYLILGDRTQLNQILINLCTNAVQAFEGGTGMIDVTLVDIEVDAEFTRLHPGLNEGPHVQLSVSDSGRGIDRELLDRIFDPFFTTKTDGQGTGLGLSVVHGIVRNLNGIVTVYSEKGKGSTFNVILPAITSEDEHPARVTMKDQPTGGTEQILLIDDERSILNSYAAILENLGYTVTACHDPRQALEKLRANPRGFDVVVTDYAMPRMTGLVIAAEMKKIRSDIRIILSSGFISKEIEDAAQQTGITAILQKPAMMNDLNSTIRKVLDVSAES
ncbi:MAG: response regulator [Spirochaetes bacterium]|nr:response regulator [Spirochaetota bacterium]